MTKEEQFGQELKFWKLNRNFITINLPKVTDFLTLFVKNNPKTHYGNLDISVDLATNSVFLDSVKGEYIRKFWFYELTLDNAQEQAKSILATYRNYLRKQIKTEKSLKFNDLANYVIYGTKSSAVLPESFADYVVCHFANSNTSVANTPMLVNDNGYFGRQLLKHWHCYQEVNSIMLENTITYVLRNKDLSSDLANKLFKLVTTNTYQLATKSKEKIDYYVSLFNLANKMQKATTLPLASITAFDSPMLNYQAFLPTVNTVFIYQAIDKHDFEQVLAQLFEDSIWSDEQDRQRHYTCYQTVLQSANVVVNLDQIKPYILEIRQALQTNFNHITQFMYVDQILELLLNKSEQRIIQEEGSLND